MHPYSNPRNVGLRQLFRAGSAHALCAPNKINDLKFGAMDYKKEIGKRIARARADKGWSLLELSAATGDLLLPNRISNYETGFRMPKPQEIVTLAKALGVRPAYMMALEDIQIPITPQEERFIKNWRTLPERERMSFYRKVEQLAMAYRDPVSDQEVEKSLGSPEIRNDTKGRKVTRKGKQSLPGDD